MENFIFCTVPRLRIIANTAQKMKFSTADFFSKCNQIRSLLQIWSHLLKKSVMENFIFFVQWKCNRTSIKIWGVSSYWSIILKLFFLFFYKVSSENESASFEKDYSTDVLEKYCEIPGQYWSPFFTKLYRCEVWKKSQNHKKNLIL